MNAFRHCLLHALYALLIFSGSAQAHPLSDLENRVQELKWESLLEAYPESITVVDPEKKAFRVFNSDIYYFDDTTGVKSHAERLLTADLEDTFFDVYPLSCSRAWRPDKDFEPGRYRNQDFLEELYGKSQQEVEQNLLNVPWFYQQSLSVTRREHVDQQFQKIFRYFMAPERRSLLPYLSPSEGAYNYRPIAGTQQLSSHSFGAAIDINLQYANYWKWDNPNAVGVLPYVNKIPCAVIEGFESYGFITGAKWYHYDTMHFEYRPELILFSRKLQQEFGEALEALTKLKTIRIH